MARSGFTALTGDISLVQTTAGTTQADAALMVADHAWVPSATEAQGIRLRPAAALQVFTVTNASSVNFYVYPPVGGNLDGAATNAGLLLPAQKTALFICFDALKFGCIYS